MDRPTVGHGSDVEFDEQLYEFEPLFQTFVADGGLDTTHVINEDYERTHKKRLCKHQLVPSACVDCRPPKGYLQ